MEKLTQSIEGIVQYIVSCDPAILIGKAWKSSHMQKIGIENLMKIKIKIQQILF